MALYYYHKTMHIDICGNKNPLISQWIHGIKKYTEMGARMSMNAQSPTPVLTESIHCLSLLLFVESKAIHPCFTLILQEAENSLLPIGISLYRYKLTYIEIFPLLESPSLKGKSFLAVALGSPENSNTSRDTGKPLGFCHISPN